MDWQKSTESFLNSADPQIGIEQFGIEIGAAYKLSEKNRFYDKLGDYKFQYIAAKNALPLLGPKGGAAYVGANLLEFGVEGYLAYNE